eukprot:9790-Heterococcus_DN1.PRE.3
MARIHATAVEVVYHNTIFSTSASGVRALLILLLLNCGRLFTVYTATRVPSIAALTAATTTACRSHHRHSCHRDHILTANVDSSRVSAVAALPLALLSLVQTSISCSANNDTDHDDNDSSSNI